MVDFIYDPSMLVEGTDKDRVEEDKDRVETM